MADKKVSELTALTNVSGDDLLLVVNDPAGTPTSRKITVTNLFANVTPSVLFKDTLTARGNVLVSGDRMTVSSNVFFTGKVFYSGAYEFDGAQIFSNTVIFNADLIANSGLSVSGGNMNVTGGDVRVNGTVVIGKDAGLHANNTIGAGDITASMLSKNYMETANANLLINDRMQVANAQAIVTPYLEVANADAKYATIDAPSFTGNISLLSGNAEISMSGANVELSTGTNLHISTPDQTKGLFLNFEDVTTQNRLTANQIVLGSNVGIIFTNQQANDFFTSNAAVEGIPQGGFLYTNNSLIIATDSNTLKRVDLYQDIRPNVTIRFQPNLTANAWVVIGGGAQSEENATLTLYKGFTYHFKEEFVNGHDIRIVNEYGGTAYSNGIFSNTNTQGLYFEVPQRQQANLYYECTTHPLHMRGVLVIK